MMRWQTRSLQVCLILLAAVPAYCQRGTFGVEFGQTSDRFGGQSRASGPELGVDGEVIVLQSKDKDHGADVIAGGELRFPIDTQQHAKEIAVYGGVSFRFTPNFSAGFHVQVHRIDLPPTEINNAAFLRSRLSMVELPGFLQYKFGPSKKAFVRGEGGPEFSPHYRDEMPLNIPDPTLDHGYTVRGTVGYNFGKWYVKGSYETRYFKFLNNIGNPNDLYNWRSDLASGGVGIVF